MSKQISAVEWLFEQYVNKSIITIEDIEQAKEMEESVTKTAYEVGIARGMSYDEEIYHKNNWCSSEQYYNETFKSE
jgi:uncharacterized protein YunC (DUF1805 family)